MCVEIVFLHINAFLGDFSRADFNKANVVEQMNILYSSKKLAASRAIVPVL